MHWAYASGSPRPAVAKQHDGGRLTVRERIDARIDPIVSRNAAKQLQRDSRRPRAVHAVNTLRVTVCGTLARAVLRAR
jgi:hypothetical protein